MCGWFILFVVGGWIMASLSGSTDFGDQVRFMANYSLFGSLSLAGLLATSGLFAVNDGNYYESINAGQNLVGAWRKWRRPFTCFALAPAGALAAYLVNFHFVDGWFKVAGFLAITVPSATIIMVADQYVLPRLFGITRAVRPIPAWREVGVANWPAIVSLLTAVCYGAFASSLLPFSATVQDHYWGPVPLETWTIAGLLYVMLVAIAWAAAPSSLRTILGFGGTTTNEPVDTCQH